MPTKRTTVPKKPPTPVPLPIPSLPTDIVTQYTSAADPLETARVRLATLCDENLIQIECTPREQWEMRVSDFENSSIHLTTDHPIDLTALDDAHYWAHCEWQAATLAAQLDAVRVKQFEVCGVDGCTAASVGPCPAHRGEGK